MHVPYKNHYSANGLWHHNSGKSFIGSLDVLRRAKPGRLYLVTAPTYPMLSDATFRSLTGLARQLGLIEPGDVKASPPPSIKLRNGAEVLFRSTDNPEMLRGPNLSGVWMDEASLSKREAFDILIGRLREGGEQGWFDTTFTPKGRTHWTYKVFAAEAPDTYLVRAQSGENPFLPKTFVQNVQKRYTKQQVRQELLGHFVEAAGNHYYPSLWPRYMDIGDSYRVADGVDRTRHVRKVECCRLLALDWAMGKPKNMAKARAAALLGQPPELTGDCTAFVVADMGERGELFMLWAVNERIPMGSNAPRLAEVCRRWKPAVVAGDDDNLSEAMLLETRRYRDIPQVKPMSLGGKNKLVRSQAAIVRAERGMMYLSDNPKHWEWVDTLSDQLSSFTGADGEPDDVADAVSILGRLADEFVPGEDVVHNDSGAAILGSSGINNDPFDFDAPKYADNRGMQ